MADKIQTKDSFFFFFYTVKIVLQHFAHQTDFPITYIIPLCSFPAHHPLVNSLPSASPAQVRQYLMKYLMSSTSSRLAHTFHHCFHERSLSCEEKIVSMWFSWSSHLNYDKKTSSRLKPTSFMVPHATKYRSLST